jgi:hypothetical protein
MNWPGNEVFSESGDFYACDGVFEKNRRKLLDLIEPWTNLLSFYYDPLLSSDDADYI